MLKTTVVVLLILSSFSLAQVKAKVNRTLTGHSVTLSCTPSTSTGVTGYNFYRGLVSGQESTTPLNTVPTASCGYVDSTVSALTTYFYTAKAVCPSCSPTLSVASNEVSAVIQGDQPLPPTGLTVGTIAKNTVPLKWKVPIVQVGVTIKSYNLFRCHQSNCPNPPKVATVTSTSYTDTCLYTSKICWYEVSANDTVNGKQVVTLFSNIVQAKVN